jgi:hypothetical protein
MGRGLDGIFYLYFVIPSAHARHWRDMQRVRRAATRCIGLCGFEGPLGLSHLV